ncbi:MAG: oxidoreductase [Bacillota bacterium]
MGRVIDTAILGFGYSARVFHAPFIECNDKFKLCSVLERNSSHSKDLYPHIKVVKNLQEILDAKDIDLVIVTTPNHSHFYYAEQLLKAGKNVIIEKPFTITYGEAQCLTELAEKNNLMLSVFHNRRWDGDFLTVKNIVKNRLLGELVEFESHFDRFRNYFKPNAWRESDLPGSGILYDLGPHLIDQALCLFGRPESLIADVRIQREGGKADDNFEIILNYGRLKVTLKAGMLVKNRAPRFILHGTEGAFVKYGLDPQENALKNGISPLSAGWGSEPESQWGLLDSSIAGLNYYGKIKTIAGNYMEYFDNIYEAVTCNRSVLNVKPSEASEIIKIIELALESAAKGRRVLLS